MPFAHTCEKCADGLHMHRDLQHWHVLSKHNNLKCKHYQVQHTLNKLHFIYGRLHLFHNLLLCYPSWFLHWYQITLHGDRGNLWLVHTANIICLMNIMINIIIWQDCLVLSCWCSRCELNWRQDRTVCDCKFRNCFVLLWRHLQTGSRL